MTASTSFFNIPCYNDGLFEKSVDWFHVHVHVSLVSFCSRVWGGIKQRGRKVNAHIRFETCITVLPQFEI